MTMKPRVERLRAGPPAAVPAAPGVLEPEDDGFGDGAFPIAARPATLSSSAEAEIAAIRAEGLTARQLRLARRTAQRRDLHPTSDFDAVRLLRVAGVDPFQPAILLELVPVGDAPARALVTVPADLVRALPRTKPGKLPTPEQRIEQGHAADIIRIQRDIQRRRRRKLALLTARPMFFVGLPTPIAGYYFCFMATPLHATTSEMVIQQADGTVSVGMSGLGGMLGGAMEANKDSIAVQGYVHSREAMLRLDADHGFAAEFEAPTVDPIQRLPPNASNEEIYRLYKRNVKIAYDPTEGLIKMEVIATNPEKSPDFNRALIGYAEQQIDKLTQRNLIALQERHDVLSSDVEVGLTTSQIGDLQTQLTKERLSFVQMRSNVRPNAARPAPVERRICSLEAQIAEMRSQLTRGGNGDTSLAQVQGDLLLAQSDVAMRKLMLSATMEQLENARIEATRQVRYLSLSVSPVRPDKPTYPRALEITVVTLLLFADIYLMISMTEAILQEQVTS